jgi:predicted helicase
VVYTPGEIVRFMIRSADWLCEKHFGKNLIDKGVEILDPAKGTGTFIVELLEHFRGNHEKLRHKYRQELHANEVAILPYYVANLNIEATYQAITGEFAEYENLCLVDTLDNVAALGIYSGHQFEMFGAITDDNIKRIKRQNARKISVIIGNPPYNAWQENYNQNNANRPYQRVDERITQTYIKEGTAQNKNSVYDMYTRFVRWASDRLGDEGIVAFVIGRKPIAKAAYDGFRKVAEREFSDIWLMDLGGDVRDNPKLSGTTHNVFGIQTGVMIALLVKRKGKGGAVIRYARRPEMETAADKLAWLGNARSFETTFTETISPDKRNDWINQTESGWEKFVALTDLASKSDERTSATRAIFKLVSSGVQTKQDEWAFGEKAADTAAKMSYLIDQYASALAAGDRFAAAIKWHRELDGRLKSRTRIDYDKNKIRHSLYRPFSKKYLYYDRLTNSQSFRLHEIYKFDQNETIHSWV